MATRKWKYYQEPSLTGIKLGSMSSGGYDINLTRACCANYAETRRNVLARTFNVYGYPITLPDPGDEMMTWISVPIGNRIKKGELSVNIYYELTSNVEANGCEMLIACGTAHTAHKLTANTPTWKEFTLDLDSPIEDDSLVISMRTTGANTISIYSVSVYQPGDAAAPDWVDLDNANCRIGQDDRPKDVFAMKLLRDNVVAVRGWKTPQNNVYNHWYFINHKTSAAYSDMGGTNDDLGHYKFAKRREITVLKLHFLAAKTGVNDPNFRVEITGLAGAPAEGAQQDVAITNAALTWYTVTWTLNAADHPNEVECAIIMDGRDNPAGTAKIAVPGVYLVESSPLAAIAHTVPDTLNVPPGSADVSDWADNTRKTSNHLWLYGGRQILVADWRTNEGGLDDFKANDPALDYTDYDDDGSIPVRGLLFSSKNSKRLRIKFGYRTTAGVAFEKGILIHTRDNGGVIDVDPRYENAPTTGLKTFTRKVDGADGSPSMVIEVTDLDIRAGDQEEHYDEANEPPMIYVACISADPAEYIEPLFVTVTEVELGESEFP